MARRLLRVLGVLVVALSLLATARVLWVGYGSAPSQAQIQAQLRFLQRALDDGAGERMQQLFPEGDFFTTALTASARSISVTDDTDVGRARALRDALDTPDALAVFGSGMQPEHGVFAAGWSLAASADLVHAVSDDQPDQTDLGARAAVVDAALKASPTGFLASYPGQYWPCDTVVAVASLARAARLLDRPEWLDTVRAWRTRVATETDPATGLLPHRVDARGRSLEGPRGSSQAVVQAYWPQIARALDEPVDRATWDRFTTAFVVREAGMVGVREYPVGTSSGLGDVDSGPLLLGVSLSASAVTLAAAREVGDEALAENLSRQADLVGLPVAWRGERRYALGVLPVGDAFLVWARTRDLAEPLPDPGTPTTAWSVLALGTLLPGAVVLVLLAVGRHRRRGRGAGQSTTERAG